MAPLWVRHAPRFQCWTFGAALALGVLASPAHSQETRGINAPDGPSPQQLGTYSALLIAAQNYADPAIATLENPLRDAEALRRVLETRYRFDPGRIQVLRDPTREMLMGALFDLAQQLGPNDNLLLFFAGHGLWDDRSQQGYWLPVDARRASPANWISNADVRDALRRIGTRHTLLITDACFAGGILLMREAFGPDNTGLERLNALSSRKAMTSGSKQAVPDRSRFLEYLIKRLQDNQSPYLPAGDLFTSLRIAVMNNSSVTPQYGTIFDSGDEGGEFLFPLREGTVAAERTPPALAAPAPSVSTTIPGTEWTPTGIRIHEGPIDGVPWEGQAYYARFSRVVTRHLFIGLTFVGRAGAPTAVNISCTISNSGWESTVEMPMGTMDPSWNSIAITMPPIGWDTPNWPIGPYHARCVSGDFVVGEMDYAIVQQAVVGGDWIAEDLTLFSEPVGGGRNYGWRFSQASLTYLFVELSFSHPAGTALGRKIDCSFDGPETHATFVLEPRPDATSNTTAVSLGWGNASPGTWRVGTYVVTCAVGGAVLSNAGFTIDP